MPAKSENIIVPKKWWESLPRKIYASLKKIETSQPWFEVYAINPNIYAIYEPYQFEETISYLILGKDKAALIDTGDGIANIKKCVEELTKLPVFVLNTHNHTDHVAQNYMFKEVWSYDGPMAHSASKHGYPQEKMEGMVGEGMYWKPLPTSFNPKNYTAPPWKITKWLHEGDVVDLGGRPLDVIYTPGHSNDSLCLLDKKARMLWVGDIFYTGGVYTYLEGGDLDQFIASYEKMIKLFPHYDYLMPSHNEPLVGKEILQIVLEKAKSIKAGKEKNYKEGVDNGRAIRRYQYDRFAIVCAVDQIKS
jgi:glyoxylase-like metal-dependent hydrolase (beta-lactamase superfamily II)